MSNMGLERAVATLGREGGAHPGRRPLRRRGDAQHGYNLGGEQSGHLIFLDHATTGDGTLAALQLLAVMCRQGKPLSELASIFEPVPQTLLNVVVSQRKELGELPEVMKAIEKVEASWARGGCWCASRAPSRRCGC